MDDLVAWLRAQLDAEVKWLETTRRWNGMCDAPGNHQDEDEVLRQVAAKRRILDEVVPQIHANDELVNGEWNATEDTAGDLVRLLALPYAGRPGSRDEWRP